MRYQRDTEIPLLHTADVIVVGGGPGGLAAAVMAARAGARTLLIERYGYLGGMAASGEVSPFMPNHVQGVALDKPIYLEWVRRMNEYVLRHEMESDPEAAGSYPRMINKDVVMLAAEDLCLEAGVKLLYHHSLAEVLKDGARIHGLVLFSKSGFTAAQAAAYVDCSGDGDLAARAGCAFEEGGPTGHSQPMTLCFKLSHLDRKRMPTHAELNQLYEAAKARGEIDCPRENVLYFEWLDENVIHLNTTRVVKKKGTNAVELSEAEIEARRQVRQFLKFFRTRVPGGEKCQLYSLAHHIGIRETRRIKGQAYLAREAFERCAKFPDAIARVNYPIDIHNPDGTGTEIRKIPAGDWYEIPYGCLVAQDVSNLLIGGRPISVDHAIHSSMRVMPCACSVGQAAGMAAALSVQRHCAPAALAGTEIRALLKERGANL